MNVSGVLVAIILKLHLPVRMVNSSESGYRIHILIHITANRAFHVAGSREFPNGSLPSMPDIFSCKQTG